MNLTRASFLCFYVIVAIMIGSVSYVMATENTIITFTPGTCSDGHVMNGIDSMGNPLCTAIPTLDQLEFFTSACDDGYAFIGFDEFGEPYCVEIAQTGGSIPDTCQDWLLHEPECASTDPTIAPIPEYSSFWYEVSGNGLVTGKRYVGINNMTKGSQLEIHCIYNYSSPSNCNVFMNRQDTRSNLILFGEDNNIQASIVERFGEISIYTDYENGAKKQLTVKADGVYLPIEVGGSQFCKITIEPNGVLVCQ